MLNDRYRILRSLGRGGMGEVFLVEDSLRDGQRMALKTLLRQTKDHRLTAGFRHEFAELAKIRHPNLAAAYDFGRVAGTDVSFFTTEFIDGVDLMNGTREASVEQLIQVAAELLRGLSFIHDHGLLHNDLKPANILLERTSCETGDRDDAGDLDKLESLIYGDCGRVKIIDFGLICREHTASDKILGTLRYISPERIQKTAADRRSDLYSLGVVLYTLFARKVPFDDNDVRKLLRLHLEAPPPPLEDVCRDLPEIIPRFVHRLLAKRPEDRFPSAAAALEHLGSALGWHEAPSASRWHGKRISAGALLFREREFAALKERYDQARTGASDSHSLVIQGPAGVGKSRLVEELRSYVQVSGGVFVEASGPVVERNLQPILSALLAGLQTSGVAGLDKIRGLIDDSQGESASSLSSFIEKLVLLYTAHVPLLLHLDDFDRASDVVRRFALELIHTADFRARKGRPPSKLLVVLSQRVSSERSRPQLAGDKALTLENFPPEVTRCFVYRVFGQEDIPEPLLDSLVRVSGGNPLFLIELANNLVERRQISYSGSRWSFPQTLEGISLPESLGNLFEETLEGLGPECLEVLHWLAVSCGPMQHGVLIRCLRFEPTKLEAVLDELQRKNLVTASTPGGTTEYVLTHAGSRDILSRRLSDGRIRQLHQRLAQNIEEEYPNWEPYADELAEHWLLSGNQAGFLRFAPKAADLLRRRGDFEKAVDYHQRLVNALPDDALGKKVQSLSRLSEMHEFLWDLNACYSDLSEIQRLAERLMKPVDKALLLRRMACVEMARHHNQVADSLLDRASEVLPELAPGVVRLAVEAPRVWTLWFTGGHDEAERYLGRTRSTLPTLSCTEPRDRMLLVGSINHLASFLHCRGELAEAAALYQRNLESLAGLDQRQAECATRCALGGVLLDMGRSREAAENLERGLGSAKEIGDRRTLSKARERYGDYLLRFGRYRRALQVTQAALQDAEALRNPTAIANSLRTLGRIFRFANELDDAHGVLVRAANLQNESRDVMSAVLCRIELASLYLERGDAESSKRLLADCEREARRHRLPFLQAQASLWLFAAQWKERRHYNETLIEFARSTLSSRGYALDYLELLRVQTEVAIESGRASLADALLAEMETLAARADAPPLANEIDFCRALRWFHDGEHHRAALTFQHVHKKSRDRSDLRLAQRCRDFIERVRRSTATAGA
jgi:serine/threonine protein kinase/tetratricopeptide (TPR) repeat protein